MFKLELAPFFLKSSKLLLKKKGCFKFRECGLGKKNGTHPFAILIIFNLESGHKNVIFL